MKDQVVESGLAWLAAPYDDTITALYGMGDEKRLMEENQQKLMDMKRELFWRERKNEKLEAGMLRRDIQVLEFEVEVRKRKMEFLVENKDLLLRLEKKRGNDPQGVEVIRATLAKQVEKFVQDFEKFLDKVDESIGAKAIYTKQIAALSGRPKKDEPVMIGPKNRPPEQEVATTVVDNSDESRKKENDNKTWMFGKTSTQVQEQERFDDDGDEKTDSTQTGGFFSSFFNFFKKDKDKDSEAAATTSSNNSTSADFLPYKKGKFWDPSLRKHVLFNLKWVAENHELTDETDIQFWNNYGWQLKYGKYIGGATESTITALTLRWYLFHRLGMGRKPYPMAIPLFGFAAAICGYGIGGVAVETSTFYALKQLPPGSLFRYSTVLMLNSQYIKDKKAAVKLRKRLNIEKK